MKSLKLRRKGTRYYYFDGIKMQLTVDTGKDEDIDRFTIGNYFEGVDSKDARDIGGLLLSLFRDAKLTV